MRMSTRWIAPTICCAFLAAWGGCSSDEPSLTLSGKITHNGQPLALAADDQVHLVFYELDDQGKLAVKSFNGGVKPDGTYEAGIEPGKYRVTVVMVKKGGSDDKLKGKYSQMASPLEKEVTGSETYDIDVVDD